jgi:hypothetical protein
MRRVGWAALMLIGISAGSGAAAQPMRLDDQQVEGIYRVCTYRNLREVHIQRIGRGEPCPSQYRERRAVAPSIPPFATLRTRTYEGGRPVCIYTYLGRDYKRTPPGGGYCTYTPGGAS